MGDHRGGVGLDGRAKYWCMLNDGIYKMGDFQKTLNPEGVDTVKTAVGFNSQTTMKQARVDAENNNVNARSEQKRVETIGQDKTASVRKTFFPPPLPAHRALPQAEIRKRAKTPS